MKKYAVLIAVMAGLASTAQAQSVTLYGTLDSSVHHIKKAAASGESTTSLVDSAVASSVWGLRGSEDLGKGLRAVFQVEGDVATNNGGTQPNGVFRRAANVGLASNSWGQLDLGLKLNPIIFAAGQVMPVNSLSFHGAVIGMGWPDFFTRNSVTWTSPKVGGLSAQLQYGASNTVDRVAQGSTTAGYVRWEGAGLTLTVANQERNAGGSASSANGTSNDKSTWLYNAKYQINNTWSVAVAHSTNERVGATPTKISANWAGVGYQMTPTTMIGLNYLKTDDDTSLVNLGTRYNLSKRTTLYTQVSQAKNGNTTTAIQPIFTNTSTSPAANIGSYAAAANTTQTAFGAGIIHRF